MKTSLNELQEIEHYLLKQSAPEEQFLFDMRLLLYKDLMENTKWQNQAYEIIQQYSRKKLKQEIEAVQQQLFTRPQYSSFRQRIAQWFNY